MSCVASSLIALTRVGIGRFWLSSAIYFAGRVGVLGSTFTAQAYGQPGRLQQYPSHCCLMLFVSLLHISYSHCVQ